MGLHWKSVKAVFLCQEHCQSKHTPFIFCLFFLSWLRSLQFITGSIKATHKTTWNSVDLAHLVPPERRPSRAWPSCVCWGFPSGWTYWCSKDTWRVCCQRGDACGPTGCTFCWKTCHTPGGVGKQPQKRRSYEHTCTLAELMGKEGANAPCTWRAWRAGGQSCASWGSASGWSFWSTRDTGRAWRCCGWACASSGWPTAWTRASTRHTCGLWFPAGPKHKDKSSLFFGGKKRRKTNTQDHLNSSYFFLKHGSLISASCFTILFLF